MAHAALGSLIRYLRRVHDRTAEASDDELLRRHIRGEGTAFDALLRRHAPMVWNVCRRRLDNEQDAEDAFQIAGRVSARRRLAHCSESTAVVILCCVLVGGGGLAAHRLLAEANRQHPLPGDCNPAANSNPAANAAGSPDRQPTSPFPRTLLHTDRYGDPLPPGVVARIGTVHFREGGTLFTLAYSPDGKMLASATADNESVIRLWDTTTGKERILLQTHAGHVYSIAFSPDGKRLASSGSGPICVWDAATGKRLRTFHQAEGGYRVAFSPDGRRLAFGGHDHTVRCWDLQSGKEILQFKGHQGIIRSFSLSADGKMLATSSEDKTIRLWEAATGKELRRLVPAKRATRDVAFSPDSKVVASGSNDGAIYLWDAATGGERLTIPGHGKWPRRNEGTSMVVFSPDGKYLAAGNEGIVYDSATGKEHCQLQGFHRWIHSLVFSPDGNTLSGESNHRIRFWDAATGKEIFKYPAHRDAVCSVVFSPDDKTLFTASWDNSLGVWDAATGQERFRFQGRAGGDCNVNKIALTPDGKTAAAWLAGELYTWDVRKEMVERKYSDAAARSDPHYGLAFSPQGRLLAAAWNYKDKYLRLWGKGITNEPIVLNARTGGTNGLLFSSDGKTVASAWSDGTARLWNVATGKELHALAGVKGKPGPLPGMFAAASSLAFSPDNKTLALGGSEGTIGLWDVSSGRELVPIASPSTQKVLQALAFAPDGKTLAAGYDDGTVRFWEAATGKMRRQWATQTGSILSLTFSTDGSLLASAGSDTTVLIWTAHPEIKPRDLSATELETLWSDLGGADAVKAYQAIGTLRAASRQNVPFLKSHLRPVPIVDAKHLDRLIADLDDGDFSVREKASAELAKYGDRVETTLRKTLEGRPALEVRRRIVSILEKLNRPLSADQLRDLRALEVLEQIGTTSAQKMLEEICQGAPAARQSREARAALQRLRSRPSPRR